MSLTTSADAVADAMKSILAREPDAGQIALRKGYHQGYEAALRHVIAGYGHAEMEAHADRLQDWRERCVREGAGFVEPPAIAEGA